MTAQPEQEDYIFALDIGTKTLLGVLMVKEGEFKDRLKSGDRTKLKFIK